MSAYAAFNTRKFHEYYAGVLKHPGTRLINAWIHSGRNAENKHELRVFVNCGGAENAKLVADVARKKLYAAAAPLDEKELDSTAIVAHSLSSNIVKLALGCSERRKLEEILAKLKG